MVAYQHVLGAQQLTAFHADTFFVVCHPTFACYSCCYCLIVASYTTCHLGLPCTEISRNAVALNGFIRKRRGDNESVKCYFP